MKTAYNYKNICLLPQTGVLRSRCEADASVEFLGKNFRLPVIPSNMKCVIDEKIALWMSEHGYFYIMHRFGIDNYEFVKKANNFLWSNISISVGVQDKDREQLRKIKDEKLRVDFITVDIAHGDSIIAYAMINDILSLGFQKQGTKIIAGNVCTLDGYLELAECGVDAVKVGIGGGTVCSTKNKTGFTYPMYSCIKNIYYNISSLEYRSRSNKLLKPVPIIADGGIREHGDIAKAIHAGADMVMTGGLFARLIDSPAEKSVEGKTLYYGSASEINKGEYRHVEGIIKSLNTEHMTYQDKLKEIEQDLQSAISYAGGIQLDDIRNAEAVLIYGE